MRDHIKRTLLLICLLICSRPVLAESQYWQTFNVDGPIYKKLSLVVAQEMRFSSDMSDLSSTQTDLGLQYALTDWFRFGATYRQVFEDRGYDTDETFTTWRQEKRVIANWFLDLDTNNFSTTNRSQFEFRFIDGETYNVRYRNMLTIEVPFELSKKVEMAPYVADEIFININAGVFNINRFYVGTEFTFIKKFTFDLYYMLQSSKQIGYWSNFNTLGCEVGYKF